MSRRKIKHWMVIVGNPTMTGTTRESARTKARDMRKTHDPTDGYIYTGKCVGSENGRSEQIILDL